MTKVTATGIVKTGFSIFRYFAGVLEKSMRYAWTQAGWVRGQANRYKVWARTIQYPPGRSTLLFLTPFIFIPLWIILVCWGVIRSL